MPIGAEKIYIPVRFRNLVNTTPSPHIVVRNERKDTGSAVLLSHYIRFIEAGVWGGLLECGNKYPSTAHPTQRYQKHERNIDKLA